MPRWSELTREQKDEYNRRNRERYRGNLAYTRMRNARYSWNRRRMRAGSIAVKIYNATRAYRGFVSWSRHDEFMQAVTGMSRGEFSRMFPWPGTLDHIIPLIAFNLTKPEHLIRAMHPSNLQLLDQKRNLAKGDSHPDLDIMSLPCIEAALEPAVDFIRKKRKYRSVNKLLTSSAWKDS